MMGQLAGFLCALALTAGSFGFGYYSAVVDRESNFNDDVLLDVSQVEIRPFTSF